MLCQLENEEHLIKMYGFEVCSTLKRRTPLKYIWFWRDQSHCDRNGWFHWWLVHLVLGRGKLCQRFRLNIWWKMLSWLPSFLLCTFVVTVLSKNDENALLSPFTPPVFISYYILIQKWWGLLSWLPCPSSVHFLLHSCSKMMRNALLAPLALECSFLVTF